ncbi:MAG TPA: glycosyltransferase family 39 protein [Vicinamibacteria bacterium]|nr:glycosyltransferase family 39 protein [Vicinamibacteria bacterium]
MRLTILLLLAAALRLYHLDAHGLWFDEMLSVSSACGSIWEEPLGDASGFTPDDFWAGNSVARVLEADVAHDGGNGVLYHLLLHGWIRLAGTSDFMVRLPSLLAGVLAVALTYVLGLRLTNAGVATWAAFLAATHPLLIRLSQEARPYSMAIALGLIATLLLVRLLEGRGGNADLVAYGLSGTALALTHYLATVVLFAHAAYVIGAPEPARRGRWRVLGALAGAALLASLWLPLGGAQGLQSVRARDRSYRDRAARSDSAFAQTTTARTLAAGSVQMAAAVSGDSLQDWEIRLSRVSMLLVLPAVLAAAAWRRRASVERLPGALGLLTVLSVAPIALAFVLAVASGHAVSFQPRYAAFVAPFTMILLAGGIAAGGTMTRAALAGQLAVVLASVASVYADAPRYRPRNAFPTVAAAARVAARGSVVHRSWPYARMVNVYLPPGPDPRQRVRARGSAASATSVGP